MEYDLNKNDYNVNNYLGIEVTNKGKVESEIQCRINKGNKCMGSLMHVIR